MDAEEKECLRKIGPYRLVFSLGRGGTGEVYKALDPERNLEVAIKIYSTAIASEQEPDDARLRQVVSAFEREAQAISSLNHRNVAKIYNVGTTEDGIPYLVMEYIDGPSLSDLIRNKTPLSYSQIADLMAQAAAGLEAAYQVKILHLDVKPGNIMLTSDNVVKLVDFGQAKFFKHEIETADEHQGPDASREDDTERQINLPTFGTPRYMSPEQGLAQSRQAAGTPPGDHRSDMYSLGATFYHLLAGQPPYDGTTAHEIIQQHINGAYVPVYVINPKVPGGLCEIIAKMMARDPGDRYQDYDELINDLNHEKLFLLSKEEGDFVPYSPFHSGLSREIPYEPSPTGETKEGVQSSTSAGLKWDAHQFSTQPHLTSEQLRRVLGVQVGPPAKSPLRRLLLIGLGGLLILTGLLTILCPGWWVYYTGDAFRPQTALRPLGFLAHRLKDLGTPRQKSFSQDLYAHQIESTKKRMQELRQAFLAYEADKAKSPSSLKELAQAHYLDSNALVDGWGNDIVLLRLERRFLSYGYDGTENTTDDILLDSSGRFLKLPPTDLAPSADYRSGNPELDLSPVQR
jgi:serine/threonine protein kinase